MKTNWTYRATVKRWVDGDTVDLVVDLGFRMTMDTRFRLVGPMALYFDAPEVRGAERHQGEQATDFARSLAPEGSEVLIETFKNDRQGKYGRWLACVRLPDGVGDVATALVTRGFGSFHD